MTVPTGKSWGSLQVSATSPSRAAGRPLIFTVADPTVTLARFCGGFTKLPPIGTWDGELVAVEPLVAAAIPSILTSELSSPSSVPVKGWGRSEEHTSELQSLMRISYAVFCLKKKTQQNYTT